VTGFTLSISCHRFLRSPSKIFFFLTNEGSFIIEEEGASKRNSEIPKKPKPPFMKRAVLLMFALLTLVCALFSGCSTDSGAPPPATTAPVTEMTTVPVTVTLSTPAPTPAPTTERIRPIPAERQVNLVLTKDRPTSEIHLQYQGGPGEIYTNRVTMRVYTSATEYTEHIMSNGKKPIPGDEIVVQGTRSGDRCEVFVISAGSRYKVMDEQVYGGMYY
jgi:hypothetical protein